MYKDVGKDIAAFFFKVLYSRQQKLEDGSHDLNIRGDFLFTNEEQKGKKANFAATCYFKLKRDQNQIDNCAYLVYI
jgi:hypothetical protein